GSPQRNALPAGRDFLPEFRRKTLQSMGNDLSFIIFDKSIGYPIEKRVFSCQGIERQKISSDQMSCRRITQVGSYSERALVELIPQHVLGELIGCSNRENSQNQHNGRISTTYFPLEAYTS